MNFNIKSYTQNADEQKNKVYTLTITNPELPLGLNIFDNIVDHFAQLYFETNHEFMGAQENVLNFKGSFYNTEQIYIRITNVPEGIDPIQEIKNFLSRFSTES